MARSKTSKRWLREHFADPYVQRAQREGWRARGAFKLAEIDRRDRILRPGMTIIDLGAAPGGWSQYASGRLAGKGRILALDLLRIDPLSGVDCIRGDFREQTTLSTLLTALGESRADLVMSDMAPNIGGVRSVDQPRAMLLAELARDLAVEVLRSRGDLLVKVFQGEGFDALQADLRARFEKVVVRKPDASRAGSRELYLLARNYRL